MSKVRFVFHTPGVIGEKGGKRKGAKIHVFFTQRVPKASSPAVTEKEGGGGKGKKGEKEKDPPPPCCQEEGEKKKELLPVKGLKFTRKKKEGGKKMGGETLSPSWDLRRPTQRPSKCEKKRKKGEKKGEGKGGEALLRSASPVCGWI